MSSPSTPTKWQNLGWLILNIIKLKKNKTVAMQRKLSGKNGYSLLDSCPLLGRCGEGFWVPYITTSEYSPTTPGTSYIHEKRPQCLVAPCLLYLHPRYPSRQQRILYLHSTIPHPPLISTCLLATCSVYNYIPCVSHLSLWIIKRSGWFHSQEKWLCSIPNLTY